MSENKETQKFVIELEVRDIDKSMEFYKEALGFSEIKRDIMSILTCKYIEMVATTSEQVFCVRLKESHSENRGTNTGIVIYARNFDKLLDKHKAMDCLSDLSIPYLQCMEKNHSKPNFYYINDLDDNRIIIRRWKEND